MERKVSDEFVDAFMHRVKLLIAGLVVLCGLPLLLYGLYIDRRLDSLASTLQHSPPHVLETDDEAGSDLESRVADPVQGQVVYVPVYSHVYHNAGKPLLLAITLSVRNTSLDREIVVKSIRYFDTKGKRIREFLEKPVRLPALATTEVVVNRDDTEGGSGANFLVEWNARQPVSEPIVEAVMIDTSSQLGISFARRGVAISELVQQPDATDASTTDTPATTP